MNYTDATLIKLTDPATRVALFDGVALAQLAAAAYDTDALAIEGPFQPLFDEFRLGYPAIPLGLLEGTWGTAGSAERVEARFQFVPPGGQILVRVDAFWRGGIVGRVSSALAPVTSVVTTWPSAGTIDADIIAALGALPADPAALERERRTRLLARLRAGMDQPDEFPDAQLDQWLAEAGASSVGDFLASAAATVQPVNVRLAFAPAGPLSNTPRVLPLAAALLIRDAGLSVGQLLMESKVVRDRLEALGLERPADPSLKPRQPLLIVWVVPAALFDDPDWPGAAAGAAPADARAARRDAAGAWLAREGIGLVVTP